MPAASPDATPRSLAPDLARGAMLLVIALAHAQVLSAGPRGDALDHAVAALHTLFVDGRGYPMFAALFGYGTAQLLARRSPADLRRRSLWMIAFGFGHTLLLFHGDILAAYGLLSLALRGASRSARLWTWAALACLAGSIAYGLAALVIPDGADAVADPGLSAAYRVLGWVFTTPLFALMAAGPFLLGVWAARHRLLERPELHRDALRRTAIVGVAIAALGALPLAALTLGASAAARATATALHTLTGYAGGLGYAALIATLAARIGERRGPLVAALVACGRRSMSCYLAQSLAWLLLFEPYFADLGGELRPRCAAAIGLGVWAITVVLSDLLRRYDRPGPAEALLRRLVGGPRS